MVMKTVKLMMATTLATNLLVTVTESADAQNSGSKYGRPGNVPDLGFTLLFKRDGQPILDQYTSDDNSGFFRGAITNGERGFFYYDDGFPDNSRLPDGYDSLRFYLNEGNLKTKRLDKNTVQYKIFSDERVKFDYQRTDGICTGGCTKYISSPIYTFELNIGDLSRQDKVKAVNNLEFIVESNLYNPTRIKNESFFQKNLGFLAIPSFEGSPRGSGYKCTRIEDNTDCTNAGIPVPAPNYIPSPIGNLSQQDAVNNQEFIVESNLSNSTRIENESSFPEKLEVLTIPSLENNCTIIEDNTDCTSAGIRVPEPNTSLAILLFGTSGLGLLLKRKMKMKQS